MKPAIIFRWVTLFGYFGLIILIVSWLLLIEPVPAEQISIKILLGVGPLMFPLRGLLHGRVYTHQWSMYLALLYFVVGVWYAGAEEGRLFGILICSFSLDFFIGAMLYARFKGREEKQAATE
jgi:uncharacterized membrane protein